LLTNPSPRHPETDRARRRKRASQRQRGQLVATGLDFTQGGSRVLADVSLRAEPGTSTHIIGPSTSDTAALLGLLVGLYPPEAGSIQLDGTELTELPLTTTRTSVALVLQDPWIMTGSIADNIAFGDPSVDRDRIEMMAKLACVDEFADRLPDGLDTAVGNDGAALTIGQSRRVALARALLRNPVVLLLEDPLRDLTAREETHALRAMNRAGAGRTTIITAPQFNPAMFAADQVLRLEAGRLESVGFDELGSRNDDTPARPASAVISGPPPMPPAERATRARGSTPVESRLDTTTSAWAIEVGSEIASGYRAAGLLERRPRIETWLAWEAEKSRAVEVKVPRRMPVTAAAIAELRNEYDQGRRLRHPGLVRPLAAELDAALPFAVYERVEGSRLSHLIGRRIDPPEALELLRVGADLARTLAYLHRLGHAHLDLGPDIVRSCRDGLIITDLRYAVPFGTEQLRFYDDQQRPAIAPEQLRGDPASAAMDVYALGALLYQVAVGELFAADSRPEPSRLASCVPASVAELVEQMLASEPADRPTAAHLLGVMRPLLLPVSPRPGGSRDQTDSGIAADPDDRVGAATDPVGV